MSEENKELAKSAGKAVGAAASGFSWAGVILNFQKAIAYLKEQAPAIAIAVFNYLRGQINQKELENKKLQMEIDKGKAHEEIDAKNRDKSASDIVDDAIRAGGYRDGSTTTKGSGSDSK